ncbi:dynamin family protein [Aquibacillus salsiterrae]|uniref:Dynamin family protein n=1 Tax=Aquibacillus salsiterrae TaxID=2950439 RepID=A0A9X4AE97_9BACI|nr:dynamin family protein [Aquibacillus salsiterrae]MDC3416274.1 dynamin family protein [Aquibacillus salsiterrae]
MTSLTTYEISAESIAAIYKEFQLAGNKKLANRTLDLLEKYDKGELVICFSGHFSAGKSTMINYLIGDSVLPQSPIPTSANVVKLTAGKQGRARVFFNHEEPVEYQEPYDIEVIKSYCKDGDAINKIEISKVTDRIPENVAILDTPGIDSSNDADRIMTESSLHTVDAMFYVMDYNHVQSEVNLLFLKEMQDRGKPIYIVINQIDKHREEELSIKQFKQSVVDTFQNWTIKPERIFYTSMQTKELKANQLTELRACLAELMSKKHSSIRSTIDHSLQFFIKEHLHWLEEKEDDKKRLLTERLEELSDLEERGSRQQLEQTLDQLRSRTSEVEKEFRKEVASTLKNAYLMPFELRELAEQFLEAQQPGFKVGLFSTKKKIEEERQQRLTRFFDSLMDTTKTTIEWKLREKITEILKAHHIQSSHLASLAQQLTITYDKERLISLIKPGARITGEYLLVYTDGISNDIKQAYKQRCNDIWLQIEEALEEDSYHEKQQIIELLDNWDEKERLEEELATIDEAIDEVGEKLRALLTEPRTNPGLVDAARKDRDKLTSNVRLVSDEKDVAQPNQSMDATKEPVVSTTGTNQTLEQTVKAIEDTLSVIHDLPGFQTIVTDLLAKKERLNNRHYTVALFGAFSAGKSSFANALIGEDVLPVSPNPTTAAINKIAPPNGTFTHGTVLVKIKEEKALMMDIKTITSFAGSMTEFIAVAAKGGLENKDSIEHKHLSFIDAVVDGYKRMGDSLGKQITIDLEQFPEFVSNESLACYVEWMELFYDCSLTRKGITLVDTPGADSVNARHTDVSFEYIKQADAILFVTYYNHPFSKADRDFLIQLGRVKDAFSLDKMFFIVNAADLAQSEEDLQLVLTYIKEQLELFGVRNPRLFPVSSKLALQEKEGNVQTSASGMGEFEQSFDHFVNQELMELLIQSSYHEINRGARILDNYLESASMNQEEKKKRLAQYEEELGAVYDVIQKTGTESHQTAIIQKIEKQLFYVQERMSIQFTDRFKEAFNPATIKHNGKEAKRELTDCLMKLISGIGHELAQELRAVSLRIEALLNQRAIEWNEEAESRLKRLNENIALNKLDPATFDTPTFSQAFDRIDLNQFDRSLTIFKNTKSFFEKNEKEKMKESLLEQLTPFIEAYLEGNKTVLSEHYREKWKTLVEQTKQQAIKSTKQYYDALKHSLTDAVDVEELIRKKNKLDSIIRQ